MRLRLTVRRHGLPETLIIWDVDTQASSSTISQLLEQVNDVVPIESGEWGMEDYAVEVKGKGGVNYECLHFLPVAKTLKDEDEVLIRPLLAQDLKVRRISGRHQISADGKHLVDGIAFGRPLLRRPADRPTVNIPPRKRRRIMSVEDDDRLMALEDKASSNEGDLEGDLNSNRELVLHADFDDDDEEGDDDFEPWLDEEDLDDDLEGTCSEFDQNEEEKEDVMDGGQERVQALTRRLHGQNESYGVTDLALVDVEDRHTRMQIRKLNSAFPEAPLSICKQVYIGTDRNEGKAYEALSRGFKPVEPKRAIAQPLKEQPRKHVPKTRSKTANVPTNGSKDVENSMDTEFSGSMNPLIEYYDRNILPEGSVNVVRAVSGMGELINGSSETENPDSSRSSPTTTQQSSGLAQDKGLSNGLTSTTTLNHDSHEKQTIDSEDSADDGTSSDESSSDDSADDDTSSDESSSDDSSDDAEFSDTSSSGSDSDSDSDTSSDDKSRPEETSSKRKSTSAANSNQQQKSSTKGKDTKSEPKPILPPGKGKKATQARNQRRRKANILARYKANGTLPADTTLAEFWQLQGDKSMSPAVTTVALEALRAASVSSEVNAKTRQITGKSGEFEARKQELLASLASGGIEVGQESSSKAPNPTLNAVAEIQVFRKEMMDTTALETHKLAWTSESSQIQDKGKVAVDELLSDMATSEASLTHTKALRVSSEPSPKSSASTRRAKLDLGAGRRLLFGALGIRTPKTKLDEEKIRDQLMKDVRPLRSEATTDESQLNTKVDAANKDPNAWRDNIIYRAVECCYDNLELSEPPFPFVQRWDPQQQGSWTQKGNRGGKRKNNQRDQPQYYNDDQQASRKKKRRTRTLSHDVEEANIDDSREPNREENMQTQNEEPMARFQGDDIDGQINKQLMNDLNAPSTMFSQLEPDDLPMLPEDPYALPDLEDGQARVGMVIAFKQLVMSEATNWQPELSTYRTAIVIAVLANRELHLTLAKRDRTQPEKYYDEETGERVYGKFDMPDDDDGDEENDGTLHVTFNELVEPKLVQVAPEYLSTAGALDDVSDSNTGIRTEEQMALGTEEDFSIAQFSHVPETPQQSVVTETNLPELTADEDGDLPVLSGGHIPAVEGNVTTESISTETRQQISHIMKEAGFRSNVPSSVMREIRPNGMETPSDAAVFERLLKDMTEIENRSDYSPNFNGIGSSPIGRPRESSSSPLRLQSSWETIESQPESSSPPDRLQDEASSRTADRATSPNPLLRKETSKTVVRRQKAPVGEAQAKWEALQPRNWRQSSESAADHSKTSDEHLVVVDGTDERSTNTNIQYPKLSVVSSSTSQITDHGRQPDFNFDDSTVLTLDTFQVPGLDNLIEDSPTRHVDPELPPRKSVDKRIDAATTVQSKEFDAHHNKALSDEDDPFPTLEEVFSQRSAKREKKTTPALKDAEYPQLMTTLDKENSKGLEELTPKASRVSQTQRSQSQGKFVVPPNSQVMDLTISSDIEPEVDEAQRDDSEEEFLKMFKRYDDVGDDDFVDEAGWRPKKATSLGGVRTQSSRRLTAPPQASLNTRSSRRKTTTRF